ncbi:hypothetical protein HG530_008766 [Fusarium avenaceum]|nr:hypothetical protein HG530_008766 [Fusarium avenaceum]
MSMFFSLPYAIKAPPVTDTTTADVAAAEHRGIAKHVGDNEEAHVGAADVDLVEMRDAAIAGGDGDVLELDVHVVLSCARESKGERTVEELATVGLARGDFKGNDVALQRMLAFRCSIQSI